MARLFDDGSNEYLRVTLSPLSGEPFVLAGWVYSDSLTIAQTILSAGNLSGGYYHSIELRGDDAGDHVWAKSYDGTTSSAETTGAYSANTWHHVCGLFVSLSSRRILLDNGYKNAQTGVTRNVGTVGALAVGASADVSPVNYLSGRAAEGGLWDLSQWPGATAEDKADEFERVALPALAAGYSPLFFRLGLVAYWPLIRDEDQDRVGGYDLTAYNTPSIAAHPRIIYPRSVWVLGSGGLAILRVLGETEQVASGEGRARGLVRALAESLGIVAGAVRLTGLLRALAETVSLGEGAARVRGLVRALAEAMSLGEAAQRARGLARSVGETVQESEAVVRLMGLLRTLAETMSLGEGSARVRGLVRALAETLHVGEVTVRVRGLIRVLVETVQVLGLRHWRLAAAARRMVTAARSRGMSARGSRRMVVEEDDRTGEG